VKWKECAEGIDCGRYRQQKDGDTPFAVEDVYTELVIDVFYIFNSTVID